MQIYLLTAEAPDPQLDELDARLRTKLPALTRISALNEIAQMSGQASDVSGSTAYIVVPVLSGAASMERLIRLTETDQHRFFFILVSHDITATDYKRLLRRGNAEWAATANAPDEIAEIVGRRAGVQASSGVPPQPSVKPTIASFLPSGGGVGNTTLAVESAVQLKTQNATAKLRVCLLDLDLQTSHTCDYLDIEPRLQMAEIVENPARLDAQLFGLFVSRHSSGLEVLAAPRRRDPVAHASIEALDALFQFIAPRYDVVIIDMPVFWFTWTAQILSVTDLAFVTGINNVVGLRQVAETLAAVRALPTVPPKIVTVINNCEPRLLGRIARKQHVTRVLGSEPIIYVREDAGMVESVNVGVPMAIGSPSSKASKDVRAVTTLLATFSQQRM